MRAVPVIARYGACWPGVGFVMVTATRGSRRTLRVFWYSARCAETSSSPSGVDSTATQTTVDLWAAVGIQCHERRVDAIADEFAGRVVELHALFYRRGRCFIPRHGLQVEQHRLGRGASDVLTRRAVGADHAVARDHHGQRVVTAGGADGAYGAGAADGGGHLGVALPTAVADVAKMLDDAATEAVGESEIDGHLEAGAPLGEVLVELTCGGVQPGGCAKHPWAHRVGELRQHGIVAFDVVGHADQPDRGGGQQQGADRAVDGAVGDVEQLTGCRVVFQPTMQSGQGLVVGLQLVEKVSAHGVWSSG